MCACHRPDRGENKPSHARLGSTAGTEVLQSKAAINHLHSRLEGPRRGMGRNIKEGDWERKPLPGSDSFHEKHLTCAPVGDTNATHRPGRKAAPHIYTSAVYGGHTQGKQFFKTSKATGTEI